MREYISYIGPVAQLVRALPCHGRGRGFEPLPGRNDLFFLYIAWDLSSAGRASALQAEGHRFEPCRSHLYQVFAYIFFIRRCGSIGRAADL